MSPERIFARKDALTRVENDTELLSEIATIFFEESKKNLQALHELSSCEDEPAFSRVAHSLKGAASNVGAIEVASIAAELERSGLSADKSKLEKRLRELSSALVRYQRAFGESKARNFTAP